MNDEELKQKRQQCWSKQGEIEQKIRNLEKKLNDPRIVVISDLDVIKQFLEKKFGFDFQAEKAELMQGAAKIKSEIASLTSEIKQFRYCWEQHYPAKRGPHGKETGEACEKCEFKPFYAENAQQEAARRKEKTTEQKKAKKQIQKE